MIKKRNIYLKSSAVGQTTEMWRELCEVNADTEGLKNAMNANVPKPSVLREVLTVTNAEFALRTLRRSS